MNLPQSKSSLETLKDCAYKFGQVYLLGKRGQPGKAAQAGTLVHKRLEVWRETGTEPERKEVWNEYKIGEIAHVMLETLPPYGTPGIVTEKDETFEIEGITYRAIKDWTSDDICGDYKTTSKINADYVLNEETIRSDIQANLSARHMDRDLTLWWTYGASQGKPKAKTVKLRVLKDETRAQFRDVVVPLAERALEILQKNDPESLPRNREACFKYGKCHLFNECWAVPGQPMRYLMTGSSLLNKLMSTKDEAPADPINPPITATTPPPAAAEAEIPKKPRGRPKKEKEPEAPAEVGASTKPIRVLYADCIPIDRPVVHGHELISKAAQTVCADLQVQHIKLIDFGKGGACLAAQLEADILQMAPGFDLALTTRTVEGREVYQTLMSLAQHIVVGL